MAKYLYGGIELQDIYTVYTPELQKTHPFAYITVLVGKYALILSPVQMVKHDGDDGGLTVPAEAGTVTLLMSDNYSGNQWGDFYERQQYNGYISINTPFWCNADLYDESGNLFRAASDPIPVLEPTDPNAYLMGFRVGQLIRGMRK